MGAEIKRVEIISIVDLDSWPKLQKGKQNKCSFKPDTTSTCFMPLFFCQLQLTKKWLKKWQKWWHFCLSLICTALGALVQLQKWLHFIVKSSNDHGFLLFQQDAARKLVGCKMFLTLWKGWRIKILYCKNFRAFRAFYSNSNVSKMPDGQIIVQCRHPI